MYYTSLPDHSQPGFDEQLHFSRFKKNNIIFNTPAQAGHCDEHVGCLSIKTTLSGEEWYGVGRRSMIVRPGQFLILNDDQPYACRVKKARVLSVFFKKDFAAALLRDCRSREESLLDNPFHTSTDLPTFFQTLHTMDEHVKGQLMALVVSLERNGYDADGVSEHLLFLFQHLMRVQGIEWQQVSQVSAIKRATQVEIYKRLCVAKEILHSSFMENLDLQVISASACLSVPQLIRQFKKVFGCTPHQYLMTVRLTHAADQLVTTDEPVRAIVSQCGFENASAFGRAFKVAHGTSPEGFRMSRKIKGEWGDFNSTSQE